MSVNNTGNDGPYKTFQNGLNQCATRHTNYITDVSDFYIIRFGSMCKDLNITGKICFIFKKHSILFISCILISVIHIFLIYSSFNKRSKISKSIQNLTLDGPQKDFFKLILLKICLRFYRYEYFNIFLVYLNL